jgi:hypothetical protein
MRRPPVTRLLAGALLAGVLNACADAAGPEGGLPVAFDHRATTNVPSPPEPPTISPAAGGATVAGRILTGDPCQELTAAAAARDRIVTLTVTATRVGEVCAAVVAAYDYTAAVRGLARGPYTVRVVHRYDGTAAGRAEQVAEQEITVP